MFKAFVAAAAGLLLVTACGRSGPFSDMQQGERGRVVRIIDGDALVLETGQSVRLVGLEAPAMNWREKDPEPYAEASSRMLDDLVMGRAVRLYYPGMTRDRYDRALAHVETADAKGPHYWLNAEMLRRGGARLRIYPDTDRASEALAAVETEARAQRAGLWKEAAYLPAQARALTPDARGFMLVWAELADEAPLPEDTYGGPPACSRRTEGSALIIDVGHAADAVCDLPPGTRVEVRGWVADGRLELVHPLHVQDISDRN